MAVPESEMKVAKSAKLSTTLKKIKAFFNAKSSRVHEKPRVQTKEEAVLERINRIFNKNFHHINEKEAGTNLTPLALAIHGIPKKEPKSGPWFQQKDYELLAEVIEAGADLKMMCAVYKEETQRDLMTAKTLSDFFCQVDDISILGYANPWRRRVDFLLEGRSRQQAELIFSKIDQPGWVYRPSEESGVDESSDDENEEEAGADAKSKAENSSGEKAPFDYSTLRVKV